MKTAKLIKDNLEGFTGHAALYKVNPPMKDDEGIEHIYVVCSTTNAMFTGIETCIFPADKKGKVTNWLEMEGSERGASSHDCVFENIGYEIKN